MNETAEDGDLFGLSLASGDFDGDGFDDLAIGVSEDISTIDAAGAIQVMYGSGAGLTSSGDQVFHQESAGVNDTSEEFDGFSSSLAASDFDGDGFDDVAVGVPFEDLASFDEGMLQVLYGTSGGISSAGDQTFHQDTPGMNDTAEDGDGFASAATSGDFDGDGFDDVANGLPREDHDQTHEGIVQIVYGTSGGLSSAGDQIFHQDTSGMNDTAEDEDHFGGALVGSRDLD
jgi:hypothetical protein